MTTTDDGTTTTPRRRTEPLELAGTVAHVNPLARSYTLAAGDGRLSAIHAKSLPQAGTKLEVPVRQLANGTFAQQGKAKKRGSRGVRRPSAGWSPGATRAAAGSRFPPRASRR